MQGYVKGAHYFRFLLSHSKVIWTFGLESILDASHRVSKVIKIEDDCMAHGELYKDHFFAVLL